MTNPLSIAQKWALILIIMYQAIIQLIDYLHIPDKLLAELFDNPDSSVLIDEIDEEWVKGWIVTE